MKELAKPRFTWKMAVKWLCMSAWFLLLWTHVSNILVVYSMWSLDQFSAVCEGSWIAFGEREFVLLYRLHLVAFTHMRLASVSMTAVCIHATSWCVRSPASQTFPSLANTGLVCIPTLHVSLRGSDFQQLIWLSSCCVLWDVNLLSRQFDPCYPSLPTEYC